jgi:hypothetical protein
MSTESLALKGRRWRCDDLTKAPTFQCSSTTSENSRPIDAKRLRAFFLIDDDSVRMKALTLQNDSNATRSLQKSEPAPAQGEKFLMGLADSATTGGGKRAADHSTDARVPFPLMARLARVEDHRMAGDDMSDEREGEANGGEKRARVDPARGRHTDKRKSSAARARHRPG